MPCNEPAHTKPSKIMIMIGVTVVAVALVAMFVHNEDPPQNDFVFGLGVALVLLMYFAPRIMSFKLNSIVEVAMQQVPPTAVEAASIAKAEGEVAQGKVKSVKEVQG